MLKKKVKSHNIKSVILVNIDNAELYNIASYI